MPHRCSGVPADDITTNVVVDRKHTLLPPEYDFKRIRMERVLSRGIFCGIERVKLFMNVHLSAT